MTDIYVRTRGSKIDYNVGFLLTRQLPKMPDSKYSGNIEYPTCILERTEDNEVYLFLSGIPSQRKDYSKTTIFYELVLEVNPDHDDPLDGNWKEKNNSCRENEKLIWLIWTWLKDVRNALRKEIQEDGKITQYIINLPIVAESELGKRLDEKFLKDEIEKFLLLTKDRNFEDEHKKDLNQKLEDFISETPKPETMPDLSTLVEHKLETWWGGVKNDDSCQQWIKLVEKLLTGENKKGKALLLNGGTDSSLKSLFVENEYLGVLLDREWWDSQPTLIQPPSENISKIDKYSKKIHQGLKEGKPIKTFVEIFEEETDGVNKEIQKYLDNFETKKKSQ